jgi:hypothetical protein
MTQNEFRNTHLYEGLYNQAQRVAALMQNTTIINDFKCSDFISKVTKMISYTGPTGHKYLVNKGTF